MPRGVRNQTAAKKAIHNPVIMTDRTETQDLEVGSGPERVLRSTGDAKDALDKNSFVQVVDKPVDPEYMAMLAFMNEDVGVRISTTNDKNAEQVFEINVNGRLEFFRRGETKTVKRFIVDRMLRLKQTVYTQKEVMNSDGVKDIVHIPHTALKYDFSVERDDNPMGKSWLRAVMAEQG